ncbi:MAG TPA: DUF1800 domain-containing protein [Candidatus Saccharimonadia bacterium]|nr:DUF1800 domain-containing protein [Candidatus Saccharimonadia bacterium]
MTSARRSLFDRLLAAGTSAASAKALPPPDQIGLLLNRATFGPREEEVARARAVGYDAWLDEQLAYESIDDRAIESQIAANLPTVAMTNGQILDQVRLSGRQNQALDELRGAILLRQVFSPRQLYEQMVEFWGNHFAMFHVDGVMRYFKTVDDREVVRRHALGKFGDLLRASAKSPAMLYSLDNYTNVVGGPNENYARELMELHTLGIGGGYTEQDVKEVARCFTGWSITAFGRGATDVTYTFNVPQHDFGPKRVLGIDIPPGQGERDGELVIDALLAHPETARYLSTKLVRRFVSDAPPASLVDAVAATYTQSGGDIRSMLRTLFRSAEFKASADAKFKRPAEYVMSVLRVAAPALTGQYVRVVGEQLFALGQLPHMWPTPDGYPDIAGHWTNTSAMLNRWNYGFGVAENSYNGTIRIDMPVLIGNARSAEQLVDRLAQRLLRRSLLAADRDALVSFAAGGMLSHRPLREPTLTARARELVGLMLGSPYFQYR